MGTSAMTDTPRKDGPMWTDANKLRLLALWFDKWDATDYADRQLLLDEGPGRNDVQRDLRAIADRIEAALPRPTGDANPYDADAFEREALHRQGGHAGATNPLCSLCNPRPERRVKDDPLLPQWEDRRGR